ncbi:unnamed protein product [Closterium sp. Naga37s-1]|nr:unnamed protein product [Closterium sp. Naga37s-1]
MVDASSAFSPLPFCAGVLRIYGYVAVVGAVIFVVIQLVSMLNFVFVWNDTWQANKKWHVLAGVVTGACHLAVAAAAALMCLHVLAAVVTGVCYVAVAPAAALMHLFFAPSSSCSLNLFFHSPPTTQARDGSSGNRSVHVLAAVVTGVCYVVVAAAAALMYLFFVPSSSCSLNLFFISSLLILVLLLTLVCLLPAVSIALPAVSIAPL